jgi:hypothetical protein
MIHWYRDHNEPSWVNEVFLSGSFLNDYEVGSDYDFIDNPDLQLNDWPEDEGATLPHYGAAFLFLTYFMDRFGEQATQTLAKHPANGLESVDEVLKDIGALDPLTGGEITADEVFLDWVLTNYLMDESISDGRFIYHNYPNAPQTEATDTIETCPLSAYTSMSTSMVPIIFIACEGDYSSASKAQPLARLSQAIHIPVICLWSNRAMNPI